MGQALLQQATNYLVDELPTYIEHADRYGAELCLLALGEKEQALDALETRVQHGHTGFSWFTYNLPMFDLIRDEPRFLAIVESIETNMARQRESLVAAKRKTGP